MDRPLGLAGGINFASIIIGMTSTIGVMITIIPGPNDLNPFNRGESLAVCGYMALTTVASFVIAGVSSRYMAAGP